MDSGRCADCGRLISPLAGARLARLFPEAAPAGASPRRLATGKQRCETCSIRRSQTNIVVCLLLLAALISYNWYDILSRRLDAEASAPVMVSVPIDHPPSEPILIAAPAAAAAPAAETPPAHPEASPERRTRRARPAARPAPPGPPEDLQGLY